MCWFVQPDNLDCASAVVPDLKEVLSVSQILVLPEEKKRPLFPARLIFDPIKHLPTSATTDLIDGRGIIIERADGQKCERCWHWEADIGKTKEHQTLCGRCIEAVKQFKA